MALSSEQLGVAKAIKRIGRRRGESRKEIVSALETGLVESNLKNLKGGDADSAGWRQERASLYKDPTNLKASINRYFDETSAAGNGKGITAGELAARVQRPAAQYRGRYQEKRGEAKALLRSLGGGSLAGSVTGSTATTSTVGTDGSARRQALLQYVENRGQPDALLDLGLALKQQPAASVTNTQVIGEATRQAGGNDQYSKMLRKAKRIDAHHFAYAWGGGHDAATRDGAVPLDCSGAVSKVLGVNPRVASEFESWGQAGEGKRVTIYAAKDGHHVLMKIGGHFWGTSASNPGGGAGWIPASSISADYLKGFVARHPPGQ